MDIFRRNLGILTAEEQQILCGKIVFVAGCGGLGGFAAEFCVRSGVGNIVLCDYDVFEETNLNRQRFSDIGHIGQSKAETAREKLLDINPSAKVTALTEKITAENVVRLISGCDLVIDALDNVETRIVIEGGAEKTGIPFIFGAVGGWCGQVATVFPKEKTVSMLYKNAQTEKTPSVMVMTAAVTAGYQAAEAVKVLLGRPSLRHKLLVIDLEDNTVERLKLK